MNGRTSSSEESSRNEKSKTTTASDRKESGDTGGINRRTFLGVGASALGAVSLLPKVQAAESRRGISFENVYDVVEDLGFDNSGSTPVDDKLNQYTEDGNLLKFPPGQYLITGEIEEWLINNFGIVGMGDSREDVEFVYPDGYTDRTFVIRKGKNWLFENFTLQQSDDQETGTLCQLTANHNLQIIDVETAGYSPLNVGSGFDISIWDPDGEGIVEGYVNRDGGSVGHYPDNSPGIYAGEHHEGVLYIRDAHIEGVGSSGVYASRTPGDIRIEGGLYRNNDIASIRVAGSGSYVKGATIVVDTENSTEGADAYRNPRGIWWESGATEQSGGTVEDCEFALLSDANNSGGLLNVASTAGGLTVRSCRFQNMTRRATITASAVSSGVDDSTIDVSNVSIVGESARPWLGAIELQGRPGSSVTDCCIEGKAKEDGVVRDGIVLRDCGSATVQNCTVDVPGEAVILDNTDANPTGISESGSCPLPNLEDSSSDSGNDAEEGSSEDGSSEGSDSNDDSSDDGSSDGSSSDDGSSDGSSSDDGSGDSSSDDGSGDSSSDDGSNDDGSSDGGSSDDGSSDGSSSDDGSGDSSSDDGSGDSSSDDGSGDSSSDDGSGDNSCSGN